MAFATCYFGRPRDWLCVNSTKPSLALDALGNTRLLARPFLIDFIQTEDVIFRSVDGSSGISSFSASVVGLVEGAGEGAGAWL